MPASTRLRAAESHHASPSASSSWTTNTNKNARADSNPAGTLWSDPQAASTSTSEATQSGGDARTMEDPETELKRLLRPPPIPGVEMWGIPPTPETPWDLALEVSSVRRTPVTQAQSGSHKNGPTSDTHLSVGEDQPLQNPQASRQTL